MKNSIYKLILLSLLTCASCSTLKPFANKRYSVKQDFFMPIYQESLYNITNCDFDSKQVSNKHLDLEMVQALNKVNEIFKEPAKYYPQFLAQIKATGIKKITIASAARSPMLQYRLTAKNKAPYLQSFHMLGLAIDLEMKGKNFDFRENSNYLKHYLTLEKVLKKAGLVFSEPRSVDPNHVELYKYCFKKNPNADITTLEIKEQKVLKDFISLVEYKIESKKKSQNKLHYKRLLTDLNKELK